VNVVESDADKIQTNLAILAFKTATTGSLAKYSLKDQIVDEFVDATGVNTGDSTYEELTSGVYRGENPAATSITPTITHGADSTGTDGLYTWYKWTTVASETYQTNTAQDYDYLVVAGGGGAGLGGARGAGGGGAGGFRTAASLAVAADTSISVIVGVGGAVAPNDSTNGTNGGTSTFSSIVSAGGGGGASNATGGSGGSGGGGSAVSAGAGAGNTPSTSPSQGYGGGIGKTSSNYEGGGGGGASEVGEAGTSSNGGDGGDGENNIMGMNDADSYAFLGGASGNVANAGHLSGGARYFSGGGGGAIGTGGTNGSGGIGGGGAANSGSSGTSAVSGTANTGGGGGGHGYNGTVGAGGSGIVIIRRLTTHTVAGPGDLILQSSDTTAEAAPTKADMIMLIEDAGSGVGTINTHIKGWVSRYETGGTKTWTEGVLVDEGDWGTDKRILAFHDLTLTGTSGTQMAYKITTHSASAVYDTRIHATSIGWK
jgi:hypothetical protein